MPNGKRWHADPPPSIPVTCLRIRIGLLRKGVQQHWGAGLAIAVSDPWFPDLGQYSEFLRTSVADEESASRREPAGSGRTSGGCWRCYSAGARRAGTLGGTDQPVGDLRAHRALLWS